MIDHEQRRTARAAYKERKVVPGIYAVRCRASGQCWAGRAPDLSTICNRLWFTLRHGSCPHRTLQLAWLEHGSEAFTFELVEELDAEDLAYGIDRELGERLEYWCERLPAVRI